MRELVNRALVGTGSGAELPTTWPEVDAILASHTELSAERRVLLATGAAATYARAGRLPATVTEIPAPAAGETLQVCSPRVRDALATMLRGEYAGVWPEALALLTHAKQRVPFDLLPELLDKLPANVREQARPILGERGLWLAKLKPEWSWVYAADPSRDALPSDADRLWSEGSKAERRSLFRLARAVDPERARAWITASWKEETADVRTELMEAHEVGLTPTDEPFLAQALSDRSGGVRVAAARLLWRLPESELARCLREKAEGSLQKDGAGLKVTLPPEKYEKAWEKEGIVEAPPHKVGRRQWWLLQTLAAVSPAHWAQRFEMTPEALLAAALKHEHADLLLDAWSSAALRDNLSEWMEPLWGVLSGRSMTFHMSELPLRAILRRLPPAVRDGSIVGMFHGLKANASLLNALPAPWSVTVSDAFFEAFSHLYHKTAYQEGVLGLLPIAAIALPRGYLERTMSFAAESEIDVQPWIRQHTERELDSFNATLQFRRILHQEITP